MSLRFACDPARDVSTGSRIRAHISVGWISGSGQTVSVIPGPTRLHVCVPKSPFRKIVLTFTHVNSVYVCVYQPARAARTCGGHSSVHNSVLISPHSA